MVPQGVTEGAWSNALNRAVNELLQTYGITAVIASGNSKTDTCTIAPANVPLAITVAGSDLSEKFQDGRLVTKDITYSWTNTGSCVSLFAPGVDILAACGGSGPYFSFMPCQILPMSLRQHLYGHSNLLHDMTSGTYTWSLIPAEGI